MTIAEQIEQKTTQLIYLRKCIEVEIAEVEKLKSLISDPFAEQKAAFKEGRQIAWKFRGDPESAWGITFNPSWVCDREYKIVPDDEELKINQCFCGVVKTILLKKCGLTGKITAEVLE